MSWITGTHEKTMIAAAIRIFSLIIPPSSYREERSNIKNRWIVRVRDSYCSWISPYTSHPFRDLGSLSEKE
jgi:hypothetical protein